MKQRAPLRDPRLRGDVEDLGKWLSWVPAFAGMTGSGVCGVLDSVPLVLTLARPHLPLLRDGPLLSQRERGKRQGLHCTALNAPYEIVTFSPAV